jgi:hypothetical protein
VVKSLAPPAPIVLQPKVIVAMPQPVAKSQLEIWTPYLPLALTIVGWLVVSRQHDKRERRKELRELIKQIELRVDDALSLTTEYYAIDGKDARCDELGAKIRYKLNALGPLQTRVRTGGLDVKATDEIVEFKQSIMGGSFESKSRTKMVSGGAVIAEAAVAGFALVDKFEKAYFDTFKLRINPKCKIWS